MNNDFIRSPASLGKIWSGHCSGRRGILVLFSQCSVPSVLIFLHFNPPRPPIFLNSSSMNHIREAAGRGDACPPGSPRPPLPPLGVLTATDKSVTLVPVLGVGWGRCLAGASAGILLGGFYMCTPQPHLPAPRPPQKKKACLSSPPFQRGSFYLREERCYVLLFL